MKALVVTAALVAATKFIAVPAINTEVNKAAEAQKVHMYQLVRP